jgi:hypothetical protein
MSDRQRKRIGRPLKAAPKTGVVLLGLRVPAELKRKVDAAARKSGRSQSEEAARRLELTFKLAETEEPLAILLHVIAIVERARGTTWRDDPDTCEIVVGLTDAFFRQYGNPQFNSRVPTRHSMEWDSLVHSYFDPLLRDAIRTFAAPPPRKVEGEQS